MPLTVDGHSNLWVSIITESGLESAKRTTEVLYGGQPEALAEMTKDELEAIFKLASSAKLLLEPGTSILDMALRAGCFSDESKFHHNAVNSQIGWNYWLW